MISWLDPLWYPFEQVKSTTSGGQAQRGAMPAAKAGDNNFTSLHLQDGEDRRACHCRYTIHVATCSVSTRMLENCPAACQGWETRREGEWERGTDRNTAVWWGEAHWTAHFVPVEINGNTQDGWIVWHSTILLLCAFHPNWKQQLLHDTLSHPSPGYLSGFSQTFNLSSHLQTCIHDFTFF